MPSIFSKSKSKPPAGGTSPKQLPSQSRRTSGGNESTGKGSPHDLVSANVTQTTVNSADAAKAGKQHRRNWSLHRTDSAPSSRASVATSEKRTSDFHLPTPKTPPTLKPSRRDSTSHDNHQQSLQSARSRTPECERFDEVSMPPIQRHGSSPQSTGSHGSRGGAVLADDTAKESGAQRRGSVTGDAPPHSPSSMRERPSAVVTLPAVEAGRPAHTPTGSNGSAKHAPPSHSTAAAPTASKRDSVNGHTATTRLSPADIDAPSKPAVPALSPLPVESNKSAAHGSAAQAAVVAVGPPILAQPVTSKSPPSAWSKSRPSAAAADTTASSPRPPSPAPKRDLLSPVFTAMESVPRRHGSSFRAVKRRKSSHEGASSPSSSSVSTDTPKSDALTLASDASPRAGGSAFDASRKERNGASGGGTGSSHGKRREPVAGFVAAAPLHVVPTPPPMTAESADPFSSVEGSPRVHSKFASSLHSNSDDTASSDGTASTRRSRRTSVRLATPRNGTRPATNASLSIDDAPRPLTRHASTLSTEQQEALRRTPSFLARSHTPPPSNLRESVQQLRKGRRVPQVRYDTPEEFGASAATAPPHGGSHPVNELSISSGSVVMLSSHLQTVSNDPKSATGNSAQSSDQGSQSLLSGREAAAGSRSPGTAASPNGHSGPAPPRASGGPSSSRPPSSSAKPPLPQSHIPSPPRSRRTPEPHVNAHVTPPTSCTSPEPLNSPQAVAAGKAVSTKFAVPSSSVMTPNPAVSLEPHEKQSGSMSLYLDEAASFDYYGTYMLSAPQFNTKPVHRVTPTASAKATDDAATTAPSSDASTTPRPGNATAAAAPAASTSKIPPPPLPKLDELSPRRRALSPDATDDAAARRRLDVSMSVSNSSSPRGAPPAAAGRGGSASSGATGGAEPGPSPRPTLPTPVPTGSRAAAAKPASRLRTVGTFFEDDDDNFFQTVQPAATPSCSTASPADASTTPRLLAAASTNDYDYFAASPSATKSTPSSSPVSPAGVAGVARPALTSALFAAPKAQTTTAAAAAPPPRTQLELSSDDESDGEDDDEDENEGNLLDGFRPAGFDARRGARRGSSIVFYLDKDDSLSSLDVVIKVASAAANTGVLQSALVGQQHAASRPAQAEYSMLRLGAAAAAPASPAAAATGSAPVRPRVTLDPYVPEEALPLTQQGTSSASQRTRPESQIGKSFTSASSLDPYGLGLVTSSPSSMASVARRGSRTSGSRHGGGTGRAAGVGAAAKVPSIFLGTTPRFAPNPDMMHRPVANTFGYSTTQRRARAEALAAGVSAEEWARSAGMADDEDDDEEEEEQDDVYGDVYTDENGDEWYWEEVEEEDEYDEEGPDDADAKAEAERSLGNAGARVRGGASHGVATAAH